MTDAAFWTGTVIIGIAFGLCFGIALAVLLCSNRFIKEYEKPSGGALSSGSSSGMNIVNEDLTKDFYTGPMSIKNNSRKDIYAMIEKDNLKYFREITKRN